MDEKVSSVTIGNPDILSFTFTFRETGGVQDAQAWGEGSAHVGGIPVWFMENEDGSEGLLEWSWVDLLSFLKESWPWLLHEERYPVIFDSPPAHPGLMWKKLKAKWNSIPDEAREAEEAAIKRFVARHDLALGIRGMYLPQIFVLRQGDECFVHSDESPVGPFPLIQVVEILENVGNFISGWVSRYCHIYGDLNAINVVNGWESRTSRTKDLRIQVAASLSEKEIESICGGKDANACFEIPESDPDGYFNHYELLAAARMTSGYVAIHVLGDILDIIRSIPAKRIPLLDDFSFRIGREWAKETEAFAQGYDIATRLRSIIDLNPANACEPRQLLASWGVIVREINFRSSSLEAVSFWGAKHGPAIIVNTRGEKTQHIYGLRTTLAHEICHLLVDRGTALPVAEVLGGATPQLVEQRAGAFAAELLLPREVAARVARNAESMAEALYELREGYKVSRKVAALQIRNSSLFALLASYEQQYLVNFTLGGWRGYSSLDE